MAEKVWMGRAPNLFGGWGGGACGVTPCGRRLAELRLKARFNAAWLLKPTSYATLETLCSPSRGRFAARRIRHRARQRIGSSPSRW